MPGGGRLKGQQPWLGCSAIEKEEEKQQEKEKESYSPYFLEN
jgi:hypothetical protein